MSMSIVPLHFLPGWASRDQEMGQGPRERVHPVQATAVAEMAAAVMAAAVTLAAAVATSSKALPLRKYLGAISRAAGGCCSRCARHSRTAHVCRTGPHRCDRLDLKTMSGNLRRILTAMVTSCCTAKKRRFPIMITTTSKRNTTTWRVDVFSRS